MKILHINSYYSTSGLFRQLYDRQVADGMDLDVYVPISHQYPEDRLATSGDYTLVSRNHHQLERWMFHLKHQRILKDLLSHYQADDYDLIHAHSLFSNGWLAWQLWKRTGTPYVVAVRNADVRTFFGRMPWLRRMGHAIMRDAAHIVFISQNSYNEVYRDYIPAGLQNELKAKTSVITNGIDDYWHENRYTAKKAEVHQPIKIVTAGKVTSGKRFVELAEMVEAYSNLHPTELHIIGPAWDAKLVAQLQTMSHVHYHGAMGLEEMKELYRQMDLFALLSYPETFGLVYPEAMSQGLPVIYTQSEGFDSFFENYQVGVSVNKTDQLGFNKAVDYILKHYPQLCQNALVASHHFVWDNVHETYATLYQTIQSKKK